MKGDMTVLAAENGGSGAPMLLMIVLIGAAFYLLLIRPQGKRRREQMQMQSSLEPGSRVITTSGMYAEVVEVEDDAIVLEISEDIEVRFVKQAIMRVLPPLTDDDAVEDKADADEADDKAVDLSKDGAQDQEAPVAAEDEDAGREKADAKSAAKASESPSA